MSQNTSSNQKSHKWAQAYIEFAKKWHWPILILAFFLTVSAGFYTSKNIHIDNDFSALLPENTPSVVALKESQERFGSTDKFYLGVVSKDPHLAVRVQDSLAARLQKDWKDIVVSVQVGHSTKFFESHALMYLRPDHLQMIQRDLIKLKENISVEANPLVEDLFAEEEEGPKKEISTADFEFCQQKEIARELGLPDDAASLIHKVCNNNPEKAKQIAANSGTPEVKEWDSKANVPPEYQDRLLGQTQDGYFTALVQVKLTRPSTDLNFTKVVLGRTDALLGEMRAKNWGSKDLLLDVAGAYEGLKDVEELGNDSLIATSISSILVLALVFWFFRGDKPLPNPQQNRIVQLAVWFLRSLAPPVLMGLVIAFAANLMLFYTALSYGQLNPFTLFVVSVIVGMGIDYCVHFLAGVQRSIARLGSLDAALLETFSGLFKPMLIAMMTTVAGLLTLLFAEFRGFYEFGVVASVGVAFSALSAQLGLPILLFAFPWALAPRGQRSAFPKHWTEERIGQFFGRISLAGAVVLLLCLITIPHVDFENNMRNLRAPAKQSEEVKGPQVRTGAANPSKGKTSQLTVVFGDRAEDIDKLHDTLLYRSGVEKDPYLQSFVTLRTFLPKIEDQNQRLPLIQEIGRLASEPVFDKLPDADKEMILRLREMSNAQTFGVDSVPEWALELLREKDGTLGRMAVIYGKYKSWDASDVQTFQDRYGHWDFGGGELKVYSSSFILSDVIGAVKADGAKLGLAIFVAIALILLISLRSFKLVLIACVPLAAGVILTMGVMGALTWTLELGKISVFNVIVIPVLLGVSIDSIVYLLSGWLAMHKQSLRELIDETGMAVTASALTTAAGFTGVLFIAHKGLRTMGELAVTGLVSFWLVALVFTPWLCHKFLRKKSDSADS